jgi:sugar phosphate isomerase/epimerase
VHVAEIAFDVASTERALAAIERHPRFCFNFDPSHFVYQNVDYVLFVRSHSHTVVVKLLYSSHLVSTCAVVVRGNDRKFGDRIRNVHMKDCYVSPTPTEVGTYGGHVAFGDHRRR